MATNLTQGFSRVNVDLPVPYETDIEQAIAVIDEVCAEVPAFSEHLATLYSPRLAQSAVTGQGAGCAGSDGSDGSAVPTALSA